MNENNNKIENIHSHAKLKKDIEGMDALRKIVKLFSIVGNKNKGLNTTLTKVTDLKRHITHLTTLPDKFNKHFSQDGWIAHESMNFNLMEKVVNLAESGKLIEANKALVDHYCSSDIEWLLWYFKNIPEFSIRYNFIELAYQDTISKRFHSCIPILLMVIDGTVNDIDKNKGFFTNSTDLTTWDSIAAHSTGLSVIRDVFNSTRNKTNVEPLELPYRNGILHGRDLGYANEVVAAKCWATLISIKDWAKAVKEGKKTQPEPEKKIDFKKALKELKQSIDNYSETKKIHEENSNKIKKWQPRKIEIGKDIPLSGKPSDYAEFYPEREAILFATYWLKKNYGNIAKQVEHFSKKEINIGQEAKIIREHLDNKTLIDYSIITIEDKTPTISEITLQVRYQFSGFIETRQITLRFICQGAGKAIPIIGDKDCSWKFIDNFFHKL